MTHEAEEVTDSLDAALFTGDAFYSVAAIAHLREMMTRWEQRLRKIESEMLCSPTDNQQRMQPWKLN